jgi:hypothetical protein
MGTGRMAMGFAASEKYFDLTAIQHLFLAFISAWRVSFVGVSAMNMTFTYLFMVRGDGRFWKGVVMLRARMAWEQCA